MDQSLSIWDVEYGLNYEFDSLLDLDKKEILFLLGYCCLKLSRSTTWFGITFGIGVILLLCVEKKPSLVLLILDILADSSLLYKHSAAIKNERERERERVWENALSLFGYLIFVGCNLE